MASRRAPDGDQPWYRTPAATFTAGGVGAALLGALVVTVVQMSDQWSTPATTMVNTPVVTQPAPTTSREPRQPFVITPSESTTSFTTSVPLSTTDIGVPTDTPSSDTTTTSPSESTTTGTTAAATTTTAEQGEETTTRTTRKRPRLNETRTYDPGG